jgi:cell division protein ZipA
VDFKDVVILGGGILIAVVIWHGLWTAWRSRRDPLRMELAPELSSEEIDEMALFKGELPNGKSRVVGHNRATQASLSYGDYDQPTQIEKPNEREAVTAETDLAFLEPVVADTELADSRKNLLDMREQQKEPIFELTAPSVPSKSKMHALGAPKLEPGKRSIKPPDPSLAIRTWEDNYANAKTILIVSVMSRTGGRWNGEDLFRLLQEKELKFGDMNIFHRPEVNSRNILFSVANSLEPGTFDLSNLDQMYTPGVSIFMQLPGPQDPLAAFDEMIEVAHSIAAVMNGELRDESRNLMTSQTIAYYRQRIEEFTRRRLRVKAS